MINTIRQVLTLPAIFDSAPSGFTMRLTVAVLLLLFAGQVRLTRGKSRRFDSVAYVTTSLVALAMLVYSAYQRVEAREHFVDDVALGVAAGTALMAIGGWFASTFVAVRTGRVSPNAGKVNLMIAGVCLTLISLYARWPLALLGPWFALVVTHKAAAFILPRLRGGEA